jgi:hypothetical protein
MREGKNTFPTEKNGNEAEGQETRKLTNGWMRNQTSKKKKEEEEGRKSRHTTDG